MGVDMFEVLLALGILWIAWVLYMLLHTESKYEDAHRRTMRSESTGDKNNERSTQT